jgi:hypothetical protein
MSGGRGGRGVKKCFLGLRQTALLSAEGKNDFLGKNILDKSAPLNLLGSARIRSPGELRLLDDALLPFFLFPTEYLLKLNLLARRWQKSARIGSSSG